MCTLSEKVFCLCLVTFYYLDCVDLSIKVVKSKKSSKDGHVALLTALFARKKTQFYKKDFQVSDDKSVVHLSHLQIFFIFFPLPPPC